MSKKRKGRAKVLAEVPNSWTGFSKGKIEWEEFNSHLTQKYVSSEISELDHFEHNKKYKMSYNHKY